MNKSLRLILDQRRQVCCK